MQFVSVKQAYRMWVFTTRTEIGFASITVGAIALGAVWPAVLAAGSWAYLDRRRRVYQALFWNQALSLHSSKLEGEPTIYEFMSRRHRNEHARRSFNRFSRMEEK